MKTGSFQTSRNSPTSASHSPVGQTTRASPFRQKNSIMTEVYTVDYLMSTINSSFGNVTQHPMSLSRSSPRLGIAILSVAFIIGFPGNAFIIWTVLTRMKKRTVTCILILHLAIADMAVILTAPFFLHFLDNDSWVFGEVICKLCHYIGCVSMYASNWLISFMSMDRFLAVAKPFTSQLMRTKTAVTGALTSGPTGQKLINAARKARPNVTALIFLSSSVNPVLYAYAGGSFIRTAGLEFMAKLFEGTSSEVSSFRKVSQAFRQRSRNESVELGKLGEIPEESKIFSTNPAE
ncbi:leukotriene B4 receptor 1-like isoform X2 [Xenopus laevis]|uniref:Leukotriene B4 receptor 1-like isoform X2 n=1 Tax=Xenopus laevis TaxID=8355 RepID=A0A8J1KYU7_XENLA|nr:leukotriene B4 receptor 1-like isoform X2 [Xenopus laevis]